MTMSRIAKIAGVSVATVSRALNYPEKVRPELRNRILEIARQYNYVYHAAAADLKRQKSNAIGVLFPTTIGPLFAETLMAIQEKIQEHHMALIVGNTMYSKAEEARLVKQFQERRVAGIIFTGYGLGQENLIRNLMRQNIFCVVTYENLEDTDINYVGFDNFKAAYDATNYLISLRHKRIGLIIGPYRKMGRLLKRFKGYQQALKDHGIQFDAALVVSTEPGLLEGKQAMRQLLHLPEPPSAVFAVSDHLAIGALSSIKQAGFQVPGDISLIGFDGVELAAYCDPPLTTVRVPARDMGRLATEVLMKSINNGVKRAMQYCLDADLIIRKSCSELK
ncbi:MAG: LacI family DNA-binding transcriptional regulator [Desulfobacterales bacterium]|nr:MAG: LacI family DNA-binding transcriptional regulator [Desulfobacterales bacterium]